MKLKMIKLGKPTRRALYKKEWKQKGFSSSIKALKALQGISFAEVQQLQKAAKPPQKSILLTWKKSNEL
jgi:hypothetical protein